MTPRLREMLDTIDNMLLEPEGKDLALVLSALRGPDGHDELGQKWTTTAVIRAVAFPRTAKAFSDDPLFRSVARSVWAMNTQSSFHFAYPVRVGGLGADVLGLLK